MISYRTYSFFILALFFISFSPNLAIKSHFNPCLLYQPSLWRRILKISPPLEQIEECVEYCEEDHRWIPDIRYFGRYDYIAECLYDELGYHFDKDDIRKYLQSHVSSGNSDA